MKHSLTAQIAEIDREIAMRRQVYPSLVSKGRMRKAEADMHMDLMRAVRDTLEWMRANEAAIRSVVGGES